MSANSAFITLKNVEKIYPNGEKAVYNFNLDIERNEFIVIVGPSGCGKSTTLRMIAGLEDISAGEIYMEDELLNFKPCKDRKMAIVFQSYALYPQMNVFNNIAFPLTINKYPAPIVNSLLSACDEVKKLLGETDWHTLTAALANVMRDKGSKDNKEERIATIFELSIDGAKLLYDFCAKSASDGQPSEDVKGVWLERIRINETAELEKVAQSGIKLNERFCEVDDDGYEKTQVRKLTNYEIKKKVYETAEKLDLTAYLDKLPKELSGGQMQRVALGRAIIKNVPVFLMDEPLSNLDAKLRLTMRSEIVKLHNKINATTIYVTHDQTEAMTMASRIVVMSRGFIQQIGTPEEVYNSPSNLFVARFIGSPSMNLFDMKFDRKGMRLKHGDVSIPMDKKFVARYDEFYKGKIADFQGILENFDAQAREKVLKIMSATGESLSDKKVKKKENIFVKIKEKLDKKKSGADEVPKEKLIGESKLEELKNRLHTDGALTVGIRPERIRIEKVQAGKKYDGCFITKPTICELLGGEYSVHFDFCDKDVVARFDAKSLITTNDDIAVSFSLEDTYVFDPITCDVIKELG